jgi:hypothetical protein
VKALALCVFAELTSPNVPSWIKRSDELVPPPLAITFEEIGPEVVGEVGVSVAVGWKPGGVNSEMSPGPR